MKRSITSLALAFFVGVLNLSGAFLPSVVQAGATLYFAPNSKTLQLGETWTVSVLVNATEPINGVKFTVTFPANLLVALDIQCGSDFSTAIQPSIANGSASINCARIGPYSGGAGKVGSVTFKAVEAGNGSLGFGVSNVTAHDGKGTNVYNGGGSAAISVASAVQATPPPSTNTNNPPATQQTVTATPKPTVASGTPAPVITSASHPDQGAWYKERKVDISWNGGQKNYNFAFDQSPSTQLPENTKGAVTAASEALSGDGVWYAHVRAQGEKGWSATSHYKIQIDGTAPGGVSVKTSPASPMTVLPTFEFAAQDGGSGMDYFELSLDGSKWQRVESGYKPERMTSGEHTVKVKAVDRAGNSAEAQTTFTIVPLATPVITSLSKSLLMLGERFAVAGTGPLNTSIEIYINNEKKETVTVDKDGKFASREEYLLFPGSYHITVKAVNADGITSPLSKPIEVSIDAKAVSVAGMVLPGWGVYTVAGLVVVVLLLGLLWLGYRLWRQSQAWMAKTRGVSEKVDDNLEELGQKLSERIDAQLGESNPEAAAALKAEIAAQIEEAGEDVEETLSKLQESELIVRAKDTSGLLAALQVQAALLKTKVGNVATVSKARIGESIQALKTKKQTDVSKVEDAHSEKAEVTETAKEAQSADREVRLSAEAQATLDALAAKAEGKDDGAIPEIADILTPEVETVNEPSVPVVQPEVEAEKTIEEIQPLIAKPVKEVEIPANALDAMKQVEGESSK